MSRRPLSVGEMLAGAWDAGYQSGHEDARAVQATWPEPTRNPYLMVAEEVDDG